MHIVVTTLETHLAVFTSTDYVHPMTQQFQCKEYMQIQIHSRLSQSRLCISVDTRSLRVAVFNYYNKEMFMYNGIIFHKL